MNGTGKDISITNYKGMIEVDKGKITLDGKFEAMVLPGIASFPSGAIAVASEFNNIQLISFGPRELAMNTSGTLTVGTTENRFNGTINVASPLGMFSFGDNLTITGRAKKILIPGGISVG